MTSKIFNYKYYFLVVSLKFHLIYKVIKNKLLVFKKN